ncbi:MAG TPA: hypothetical protein VMG58_09440, partial [Candidatus Sulfotelmatobacter sp.]|nr:hypothetical protein [Candidatus Sulfotelmatobacter sp.]
PGTEPFLATYELTSPDIPELPAWRTAMIPSGAKGETVPDLRTGHQDLFALEFTIYPSHQRKEGDRDKRHQ